MGKGLRKLCRVACGPKSEGKSPAKFTVTGKVLRVRTLRKVEKQEG